MVSYFTRKMDRLFTSRRRVKIQLESEIKSPYSMTSVIKYIFYTFLYNKNMLLYIKTMSMPNRE